MKNEGVESGIMAGYKNINLITDCLNFVYDLVDSLKADQSTQGTGSEGEGGPLNLL